MTKVKIISHILALSIVNHHSNVIKVASNQRWSPRGHILKTLALTSRPQVLENWPVLGSRTALFFELLKFCGALEKFFERKRFFRGDRLKNFCEDLFFLEHLRLCPWSLASSIPVLGLESVCPRKGCPWPRIFFLCPWPWPRALCPRLHLCFKQYWAVFAPFR